ncbi:hypothetical protein [Kineothrix sp. MB12-C1]|uniref:hypothetical protein n=1 Tax=Kineothrix sp. MB12-C1 TaxID=3070215 RepID=UPI0027D3233F|nr:hypothetical protein [Kineothrix sp. MB12-C1]WMC93218.1 hypothetical protein RBB56_02730 [Kineothrix sp. MB12-C1]
MTITEEECWEILSRNTYADDTNIKSRILSMDKDNTIENIDAINEVVLWKLNRSIHISEETISMLNSIGYLNKPSDVLNDKTVYKLIEDLLSSKGIKLAVASTILHFYYPNIFPIIDQRSYRELTSNEYPIYSSKDKDKKYIELYLDYINRCWQFNTENCPGIPFERIDNILYQRDKEKGNKVKY